MPGYESATRRMHDEQPTVCALVQDTLPFYLDNELSPESRAYIDAHLESCDRCASFLTGARSVQVHLQRPLAVQAERRRPAQAVILRGRRQVRHYVLAFLGAISILMGICAFVGAVRVSTPRDYAHPPTAVPARAVVVPVVPIEPTATPIPNREVMPAVAPTSPPYQTTPTPAPVMR